MALVRPQLSYPGVYVQEVSGGPGPIAGVATSITAFLGRAIRGPVDEAVTLFDFASFADRFGGLGKDYPLSYAVRDFFQAGGTQAIVVRLGESDGASVAINQKPSWRLEVEKKLAAAIGALDVSHGSKDTFESDLRAEVSKFDDRPLDAAAAKAAQARMLKAVDAAADAATAQTGAVAELDATGTSDPSASGLVLKADNAGAWGNDLRISVDYAGLAEVDADELAVEGLTPADLFNLRVTLVDARGRRVGGEDHVGVTLKPGTSRSLDASLSGSTLVSDTVQAPGGVRPEDGAGGAGQGGKSKDALALSDYLTEEAGKGFQALDKVDLINLMCVPPDQLNGSTSKAVYGKAVSYAKGRRAFVIVDGPAEWDELAKTGSVDKISPTDIGIAGESARYAAAYFPRMRVADPEVNGAVRTFPVSGMIAGLYSRNDATRGVWKAPAGISVGLSGIEGLTHKLSDAENGVLNPVGINCLRTFPVQGTVVWGARTLAGADAKADEYKYVPVRRTALYIGESLYRGTQWAVFEPNDEPLWAQLRLQIDGFMNGLFRQGAFQGSSADAAYFVRCDASTTTQSDIDSGVVNVVVGFAPLKPAEFVVIYIQQKAGANQ